MTHHHWDARLHPRDPNTGEFTDHWVDKVSATLPGTGRDGLLRWEKVDAKSEWNAHLKRVAATLAPSMSGPDLYAYLASAKDMDPPREIWASGPHRVYVSTPREVPVREVLAQIANLHQANPSREPIRLTIQPPYQMFDKRASGETIRGTGMIWIADDAWEHDPSPHAFMPIRLETAWPEYVIAHEWGHAIDYDDRPGGDTMTQDRLHGMMTDEDAFGEYGAKNQIEGHAEAFAEWYLSGGDTDNQAAISYADMYGWNHG